MTTLSIRCFLNQTNLSWNFEFENATSKEIEAANQSLGKKMERKHFLWQLNQPETVILEQSNLLEETQMIPSLVKIVPSQQVDRSEFSSISPFFFKLQEKDQKEDLLQMLNALPKNFYWIQQIRFSLENTAKMLYHFFLFRKVMILLYPLKTCKSGFADIAFTVVFNPNKKLITDSFSKKNYYKKFLYFNWRCTEWTKWSKRDFERLHFCSPCKGRNSQKTRFLWNPSSWKKLKELISHTIGFTATLHFQLHSTKCFPGK